MSEFRLAGLEAPRNDDFREARAGDEQAGHLDPGVEQELGIEHLADIMFEGAAAGACQADDRRGASSTITSVTCSPTGTR